MRQQIDCAVLRLAAHRAWLEEVLNGATPALARVRLHQLEWEAGQDLEVNAQHAVTLPVQALAQSGVSLRRFDLCLLPVSVDTLAWTRQALAMIPRGPFLPLVGIFQNLKSAAMQDLLELGVSDFVRLPLCLDEFRARVLTTASRVPRRGTLREPEASDSASEWLTGGSRQNDTPTPLAQKPSAAGKLSEPIVNHGTRIFINAKPVKANLSQGVERQPFQNAIAFNAMHHQAEPLASFREEKNMLVNHFERTYITQALIKHRGNIAMAARASNKHRRAFWALMRKHDIAADLYREGDSEE